MRSGRTSVARQVALILILVSVPVMLVGCGDQMAKMEANQIELEAMIAANARQIATVSNQIHAGQGQVAQQLAKLQETTKDINTQVLTVQNQQAELQGAVVDSEQRLNKKIAQVSQNQTHLTQGVSQVADLAQKTNAAIGAVARDQANLHQAVEDQKRELAGRITTIAKGQEVTRAGITQLGQANRELGNRVDAVSQKQDALQRFATDNSRQLAGQITAVSEQQQATQKLVAGHHANLSTQIGSLAKGQEQTQASIANLNRADQELAAQITGVSRQQQAMQKLTTDNHTTLTGRIDSMAKAQEQTHAGIAHLQETDQALGTKIAAVSQQQLAMQELTIDNHTHLTGRIDSVAKAQEGTHAGIANLQETDRALATQIAAVSTEQEALQKLTTENHARLTSQIASVSKGQEITRAEITDLHEAGQALLSRMVAMSEGQESLRKLTAENHGQLTGEVAELRSTTQTVAADLTAVASEQTNIRNRLNDAANALTQKLAVLETNQFDIQSLVDSVVDAADETERQVSTLAATQSTMQQAQSANNEALNNQLAVVTKSQQYTADNLDAISTTTVQLSLDVLSLSQAQANLEQAVAGNQSSATTAMASLAEGQKTMQGRLDEVATATDNVARQVSTLGENQSKIEQAVDSSRGQFTTALEAISKGQQNMQKNLQQVMATSDQVTGQVNVLGDNQIKLEQAIEGARTEFTAALGSVTQGQWAMQGDIEKVSTKTDKVAQKMDALNLNQSKLEESLQAKSTEFATALSAITKGQDTVNERLDAVSAVTEQVAVDVMQIDEDQAELAQVVQSNREELVAKLNEIATGQQQWLARFDATEAKVEAMTQSITSLEERVTKLQGTLQSSLTDLNALLDTEAKERTSFEATVRQDVQNVSSSVSHLAEVQAGLVQDVQKVQNDTQSQSQSILSALKKLQQEDGVEAKTVNQFEAAQAQPEEVMLP